MDNPTPAQVATLATLFGITPETHKHLRLVHNRMHDDRYQQYLDLEKLPDPLGPDADGVWLAPAMAWCCDLNSQHGYFSSVRFIPQMGGGWYCVVDSFLESSRNIDGMGDSMTAAYLQACLAARVPEVCAILESPHA